MTEEDPSRSAEPTYKSLRSDVLSCRLRPGTALNISELTNKRSLKPTVVREALVRLTAEGLATGDPRHGFRVTPVSAAELRDLTAVRVEIESHCLRSAMASGDHAWEERVLDAYHSLARLPERDAHDPQCLSEEWAAAHRRFNDALASACTSKWMLRLRELLYTQSERYRRLSLPLAEPPRDLNKEHGDIMRAACARDVDRALGLLTTHIQLTAVILLNTVASNGEPLLPSDPT